MVWPQQTLIFFTALTMFIKIQQVVCSGVFELRLKSFINENGKDSLGQCCSGERNGHCTGPCRTRFRVCLKHYQTKIDTTSACTFGDVMTPVLGENTVLIPHNESKNIPGFTNPIRFPFDFSWPGTFSLIVEAWHDATSSNTSVLDAGISTRVISDSLNVNGISADRTLINRLTIGGWLDVSPNWTEEKHKSPHLGMSFEYRVTCDAHYYGSGCANLCRPRDDNFGHYICSPNGEIKCFPGWKGDYCTKPLCLPGCDETHGFCTKPGECLCHSGWKGQMCNECERYPGCAHGTCQKPWDCLCDEGWGGLFCNRDLNYCTNHKPCGNGGTCFNTGEGLYTCSCPPGYAGIDCDKKLSNCSHKPCLNGASCKENGTGYQCECSKGWYGTHCEIAVQTCEAKPCRHGGTCMDTIHGYKCSCPPGYNGSLCQNVVNHCAPNPCANGGNCNVLPNNVGYKCGCASGFAGATCQTNINDCLGNPCRHGRCIDMVNDYRCQCEPGYAGPHCQEEVDMCVAKPCSNNGTCVKLSYDYRCNCQPGFSGRNCNEVREDECGSNPCFNGATCVNTGSGVRCECAPAFSGPLCENENGSYSVSTAIVGSISKDVSVVNADETSKLSREHWYVIAILSVAVPTLVLIAALVVNRMKQRRKREQKKADEEARLQNEHNSVHSSITKRGDAHMIKNMWGQDVKNVDAENADFCYPKPVYAALPADPNIAPVYTTLQRSRSQKQLNIDPPVLRHVYNRVSCKDLDSIVRTGTPALDNRLSVLSINISHSNLSENPLSKQQQCSQLLEKDKSSIHNNTLNSSVLNSSMCGGSGNGGSVYVIDEDFTQTLFATEV